jgi:hypothetical protein
MLEILKVDNIMKLKMAVFIHKIINCNSTIPPVVYGCFKDNEDYNG